MYMYPAGCDIERGSSWLSASWNWSTVYSANHVKVVARITGGGSGVGCLAATSNLME